MVWLSVKFNWCLDTICVWAATRTIFHRLDAGDLKTLIENEEWWLRWDGECCKWQLIEMTLLKKDRADMVGQQGRKACEWELPWKKKTKCCFIFHEWEEGRKTDSEIRAYNTFTTTSKDCSRQHIQSNIEIWFSLKRTYFDARFKCSFV